MKSLRVVFFMLIPILSLGTICFGADADPGPGTKWQLLSPKSPVVRLDFELLELWRFDVEATWRWKLVEGAPHKLAKAFNFSADQASGTVRLEFDWSKVIGSPGIGLYYAKWRLSGFSSATLVYVGDMHPEDLEIGDAPPGMITVAIPFEDGALAAHVPDPAIHCRLSPASAATRPSTDASVEEQKPRK